MGQRGGTVSRLFDDLGRGDPISWVVIGIFLALVAVLGLVTLDGLKAV